MGKRRSCQAISRILNSSLDRWWLQSLPPICHSAITVCDRRVRLSYLLYGFSRTVEMLLRFALLITGFGHSDGDLQHYWFSRLILLPHPVWLRSGTGPSRPSACPRPLRRNLSIAFYNEDKTSEMRSANRYGIIALVK